MRPASKKFLTAFVVGGCGLVGYNVQNRKYPQFQKQEVRQVISQEPYNVQIFLHLPLNALSRLWGRTCNIPVPTWGRPYLFGLYARTFNCSIKEAEEEDLKSYKTLGEFFRRSLKPEIRPISDKSELVSPCDGTILSCGPITDSRIEHVKTKTYSLKYFLGPINWKLEDASTSSLQAVDNKTTEMEAPDEADAEYFQNLRANPTSNCLYHCTIYLAPGDYHRFHSPTNWLCKLRRYFPGYLLSVSPWMAGRFPELMNINERVVYVGSWRHGFFSIAAVGATNVGSIRIYKDQELITNQRAKLPPMIDVDFAPTPELPASIGYEKGEAFGEFNLGSTIVLIFEAPHNFKFDVASGGRIKFGEALGC